MEYKTIQDTIHGSIKVYGPFLKLLETPEVQRLHNITQLGLTKLIFPGANHTRLEHSLGAYWVAERMAESLELPDEEKDIVMAAALLHDIGHAPFSHTLESHLASGCGKDHMDITKELILGNMVENDGDTCTIPEILEDHGISPKKVSELIKGKDTAKHITEFNKHEGQLYFGEERYLYQMIHGPVDADQMDYLLRDSHYTGAAHGVIDLERLLQTLEIHNGNLVITKGGIPALEGVLVARSLMFSSVYLHKTARIAELMLAKAVHPYIEDYEQIYRMTDWELFSYLCSKGGFQKEIVDLLKYRKLYKRCMAISRDELHEADGVDIKDLTNIQGVRRLEKRIAYRRHISPQKVIVDVPGEELKLSEPRLERTNVKVLDDNKLYELSNFSPLCRALQKRQSHSWGLMVSCPKELKNEIGESACKEILSV